MINLTKKTIETNWKKPLITPKSKIDKDRFLKPYSFTQIPECNGLMFLNSLNNNAKDTFSNPIFANDFKTGKRHLVVYKTSGTMILTLEHYEYVMPNGTVKIERHHTW